MGSPTEPSKQLTQQLLFSEDGHYGLRLLGRGAAGRSDPMGPHTEFKKTVTYSHTQQL